MQISSHLEIHLQITQLSIEACVEFFYWFFFSSIAFVLIGHCPAIVFELLSFFQFLIGLEESVPQNEPDVGDFDQIRPATRLYALS